MAYNSELGDESKIRVSSSALIRVLSKKIVRVIGLLIILLTILYLCFAATIIRFVPSTSGTGVQLVKNVTSAGGILEDGDRVMVNPEVVNEHGVGDYLRHAFLPSDNYLLVEVQYGPYGEFGFDEETLEFTYEGEETGLTTSPNHYRHIIDDEERGNLLLNKEYIALCVSGNCETGSAYIVNNENIIGEVVDLGEIDTVAPNPVIPVEDLIGGESN